MKIDHEGNILAKPEFPDGLDYGVNRAGFVIHSAIHMAKPDVACVIHTHTWPGMAVSTMECGLLPNTQTSMRFAHISYHDFDGVVLDLDEREALVNEPRRQQRADPAQPWPAHHRRDHSRGVQRHASAGAVLQDADRGDVLQHQADRRADRSVVEATYRNYQPKTRRPFGLLDWPALLRKLDRIDPGFRD